MNGYFNDDANFSGTVSHAGRAPSIPNVSIGTNGIVAINGPMHRHTIEWTGYFRAQESGRHNFWLNSDDASYMWIGTTSGFTPANAVIKNPGLHTMVKIMGSVDTVGDINCGTPPTGDLLTHWVDQLGVIPFTSFHPVFQLLKAGPKDNDRALPTDPLVGSIGRVRIFAS